METILLVSSNQCHIEKMTAILSASYHIDSRMTLQDSKKEIDTDKISLILLDLHDCGEDGFLLTRRIKRMEYIKKIPLILFAEHFCLEEEEKGLLSGAEDYIAVLYRERVMLAKIRNHIHFYLNRMQIENLAWMDGLTGIPNRRHFNASIIKQFNHAAVNHQDLSVAIIDIDYFKDYNDHYGHLKGDQVLKEVASQTNEFMKNHGYYVARYGGEEFVIIMENCKETDARRIMNELIITIQKLQIEHFYSKAADVITISAGGATIVPGEDDKIEAYLEIVDSRLYRAKAEGRNQVVWEMRDTSLSQLEIFLFGRCTILSDHGLLTLQENNEKTYLLLVYLILNRYNEYTKEELMIAIGLDPDKAESEMECKQTFELLQIRLEELKVTYARQLIVVLQGVYHWNNNFMCIVDVELFMNLLAQAKDCENEKESMELYKKAMTLYRGDFLCNMQGVSWIEESKQEYRTGYVNALICLLEYEENRKRYDTAIQLCMQSVGMEQVDPRVHFYFLVALLRSGKKEDVINKYNRVLTNYQSLLGMVPMTPFMSMYKEVIRVIQASDRELLKVRDKLREVNCNGAFECEYDVFRNLYQLTVRMNVRHQSKSQLCMISYEKGRKLTALTAKRMIDLRDAIKEGLRQNDMLTELNYYQYLILLTDTDICCAKKTMHRIINAFCKKSDSDKKDIRYEIVEGKM